MKINFTNIARTAMAMLLLCIGVSTFAQTDGSGLVLRLTIDGVNYDLNEGSCGFSTTSGWGGSVPAEFCAPVAWGYDITPDSLGCDSIPAGQLTGKIAMIRRGVCEFGLKCLNAEKAGAIAVMVVNGTAATHGDDCNAPGMGAGAVGAQVTVPAILIARVVANQIDAALKAGKTVEACFLLPRTASPYAEYHYGTPVSQISALSNIGMNVYNREDTPLSGWVLKADIQEPSGNVTTLELPLPDLVAGADTLVFFPAYTPPAETGKFKVTFSNNKYAESRDTLYREFEITDYTFAMDKLSVQADGGARRDDLFAPTLKYQIGSLISTGPDGGVGRYCTFGITDADTIYVPDNPSANIINVLVYDADLDNDGLLDLLNDFEADLTSNVVGLGTYEVTGEETETNLLDVIVTDFNTGDTGITMLPNHPYYVTVLYDGSANGSGKNCAFSNSAYVDYLAFVNENQEALPSTPMKIGTSFSYWGDRTVITRLQLEGYESSTKQTGKNLDKAQYTITPNPANDIVSLNLDLKAQSKSVNVSILSGLGNTLRSQTLKDFQNGQINFNVTDIPSGTYLMWIRTAEGQAMTKVTICH